MPLIIFVSSCCHRRLSTDLGKQLQLKSHPKMISYSLAEAANYGRYDYLAKLDITVGEFTYPLVVRVGWLDQPAILGLDFQVASHMNIDFAALTYRIHAPVTNTIESGFRFIDYDEIMREHGIAESDLVPISALPEPISVFMDNSKNNEKKVYVSLVNGVNSVREEPGIYLGMSR